MVADSATTDAHFVAESWFDDSKCGVVVGDMVPPAADVQTDHRTEMQRSAQRPVGRRPSKRDDLPTRVLLGHSDDGMGLERFVAVEAIALHCTVCAHDGNGWLILDMLQV